MRKLFFGFAVCAALVLSSCYSHTFAVGQGAKGSQEISAKNHFVIMGLVGIHTSDPQKLAGGAKDFEVTEYHSFLDLILTSLTAGIYTPTTTIVRK